MSHADILDIDRGHIFRKHRHKNNKKVAVIYEKMVKNRPGFLPASCYVDKECVRIYITRFSECVLRIRAILPRKRTHDLTQKFCVQTVGCHPVVDPAR